MFHMFGLWAATSSAIPEVCLTEAAAFRRYIMSSSAAFRKGSVEADLIQLLCNYTGALCKKKLPYSTNNIKQLGRPGPSGYDLFASPEATKLRPSPMSILSWFAKHSHLVIWSCCGCTEKPRTWATLKQKRFQDVSSTLLIFVWKTLTNGPIQSNL